jgi:hypothetical protein
MIRKDTLWKAIIEELIDDFILFFFAEYAHLIDFESGFEFLDKELQQIFPESETDRRHADKLIKAKLKDGSIVYFLIHIEVQGYDDEFFDRRMYEYGYRIDDRYKLPLTALAIYTHSNKATHFRSYHREFLGTIQHYEFPVYILADHTLDELKKIDNPFAIVMATALMGLKRKPKDTKLLDLKRELVKNLYAKGYAKSKISALLDFIRYYVNFTNSEFSSKFEEEIDSLIQSNKPMGIQEAIKTELLKIGEAKGIEIGIEIGEAKGIEIGEAKGIEIGEAKGIEIGEAKGIEIGEAKGIEIGEALGEEKGLKFAIAQLLLKDFSEEQTSELLSVTLEKVKEVATEIAEGNIPHLSSEEE